MADYRKPQKCEHQEPYQMTGPVNFCSWPYCTCLREGQERQGMRYEDDYVGYYAAEESRKETK